MYKWHVQLLYAPPDVAAAGTTENVAGSSTEGNVTSGTASDAMIKAAMASESSSDTPPTGAEAVAGGTGETVVKPAGTPSATTPAAKGPQVPTGEAPPNRIEAAVKNARETTRAEVEAEYAWAKGVDPKTVETAFGIVSEMLQDTPKFVQTLAEQLGMRVVPKDTPTEAAKPVAPYKLPAPALRSEDGRGAYDAEQLTEILAHQRQEILAELGGQMKPLLSDREAAAKEKAAEAVRAEGRQTATDVLTEMRKQPYFTKENEPEILKNLQAIPAATRAKIGAVASLYQAYNQFLAEKVFPTIGTTAEQQVRDANRKKAAASAAAIHPVSPGGDTTKPQIQTVSQLSKYMESLEAAGST
jgi:hypothetical protein